MKHSKGNDCVSRFNLKGIIVPGCIMLFKFVYSFNVAFCGK